MRTVAGQARDGEEFTGLLAMLGLDDGPLGSPVLLHALAVYVRQLAAARSTCRPTRSATR